MINAWWFFGQCDGVLEEVCTYHDGSFRIGVDLVNPIDWVGEFN